MKRLLKQTGCPAKIVNNKKYFIDKFVPAHLINEYANEVYDTKYKGEDTKSIISMKMLNDVIIPYLQKYDDKLIYINCNRIVKGWEGNYIRINPSGRPKNISIIEKYSELLVGKFSHLINLLELSDEEIQKYTVDNMHLTYEGSEYLYKQLIEIIELWSSNRELEDVP